MTPVPFCAFDGLTLQAQYVQTRMLMDAGRTVASELAALLLTLPTNAGFALLDCDPTAELKLKAELVTLAVELNLPEGQDELPPGHPTYRRGLSKLVDHVVSRYEQDIAVKQFKIKLLADSKREEEGKKARRAVKNIAATRKWVLLAAPHLCPSLHATVAVPSHLLTHVPPPAVSIVGTSPSCCGRGPPGWPRTAGDIGSLRTWLTVSAMVGSIMACVHNFYGSS